MYVAEICGPPPESAEPAVEIVPSLRLPLFPEKLDPLPLPPLPELEPLDEPPPEPEDIEPLELDSTVSEMSLWVHAPSPTNMFVPGTWIATVAPASIDSIGAASAGEAVRTRVPARKQAGD